ncbi:MULTISPECIES: ParA family protein [unclassified Halomonas]|uniref:ParA family protein n=1 Tax=unclassified Halomonas TaxID=2609666 RepID=UPI0007D95AA5|nr:MULTISPECIES: ParA family protein [unclassified Halomonas]MBT2787749.1 ParA family protein [Halomonas sp. ISL-106]MBT2796952.1 ParA family protein [Halomonas sp. ISL-104]OAL61504.1 cobyrinic acid a,c-diamide synthase [Halomonas sp. ALS9]
MRIISIFNNKGGVGKSTLTYHLGAALSEQGKRVLLVDLDPQSNLTLYGLTEHQLEKIWNGEDEFIADYRAAKNKMSSKEFEEFHKKNHSIHYLLKPIEDGESDETVLCEPIKLKDNYDLIPGRLTLHLFENKLSKQWSDAFLGDPQAVRIVTAIRKICEDYAVEFNYDVVLIDTSPSLGALNKIIISNSDTFLIPCAPDMFSDYGIRNIGNALKVWQKEFNTMHSLLSDSKREYFPKEFVRLLGYTVYNAKKRTDAPNELNVALAHYNYAKKLPSTINKYIPQTCLINDAVNFYDSSIGENSVIHGHGTLPTMAQKYKKPMWEVPDVPDLGEEKNTIRGNAGLYRATQVGYLRLAQAVSERLELL